MSKKRNNIIALLVVLGVILVSAGVSYSIFNYNRSGSTQNSISSGAITFHYEEGNRSISLDNALPMTDSQGKAQTTAFDFTIESSTSQTIEIPYYITVRRSISSETALDSHVKIYLTKVTGEGQNEQETEVALINGQSIPKFSELGTYTNPSITIPASEKALYTDKVPVNSNNYSQKYRLRMWIDEGTNFSGVTKYYCGTTEITQVQYENTEYTCESGEKDTQIVYPYNNKSYTLTVNVYSEGQVAASTPTIPTMAEMCPGCRFLYVDEAYQYYQYGGNGSILSVEDTKEDYNDVITETGKPYFLGVILSDQDHGKIQRAFACGIKGEAPNQGTPFCIEGALYDTFGGDEETRSIVYAANSTLLNDLYGPYNENTTLGCRSSENQIGCAGSLSAAAQTYGVVNIGNDIGSCIVNDYNNLFCSEF